MLISYIQSIMMIILEVICCKIFFESFAEKRSKNNYRNYSIILGIVVCEYVIASLFYDKFILKQILAIVAVAVFMCFYFKIHFGKAIILSLLFQALLLSVDYFTLWLNVSLFDSIAEISRLHFVGGSLITVLGKIILFLVVLLIRKKVGGESSDVLRSTDWLRFIFFPVFTIFTVIALIMTSGNIENQKQENVFLVIALCLAGMNIVVFYMINDILKREIKIRENEVFQLKARNQTDMYRSISENFVKQRKKTHEYKNQIMCIESLIEMENYDELKDYVKSISGNLSTELDYIKTNNVIIDAILNSKYKETLDKGIVFIFQINDLSGIKMCDEDIVVILSNLLNNAMKHNESGTHIKIGMYRKNGYIYIKPIDASVVVNITINDAETDYNGQIQNYKDVVDGASYTATFETDDPNLDTKNWTLSNDEISTSGRYASEYEVTFDHEPTVLDADGNPINSENVRFNVTPGTFTINKIDLVVKANNKSKEYDGTPLVATNSDYTVVSGLADTDSITSISLTGYQLEPGTSESIITENSIQIRNSETDNTAATNSYDITLQPGTLEITNDQKADRVITITATTDDKIYDGTPLTNGTL